MFEHSNLRVTPKIISQIPALNPRSRLPLHVQVQEILRRLLVQKKWTKGSMLPDEVSLSIHWGISRNTVRAAFAPLVNEGLLERKSGVGTRIRHDRHASGIGAWQSFTREMEKRGVSVETYLTRWRQVSADAQIAKFLRLNKGRKVLCLERVRGWDGIPAVYFQSYFHPRLGLTSQPRLDRPLYEWISEVSGVRASRSSDEFVAVAAELEFSNVLKVPLGTPLMQRTRVVFDAKNVAMEYAVVHYRSDRFVLNLTLEREEV